MEITKLNVGQIVSMNICTNKRCKDYQYFEERKYLFFFKQKAGFYNVGWSSEKVFITPEEIEKKNKHLVVKDKVVYYKPNLEFRMSNGTWHTRFFETEEELNKFVEASPLAHVYWIDKK